MAGSALYGEKLLRKGDCLFKAGDPADKIYIIQQGLVSISISGAEKSIELFKAVQPQLVGEEVLRGAVTYSTTAVALNDTSVIEIAASEARKLIQTAPPVIKFLANGMLEKQILISEDLKLNKLEGEGVPCPMDGVAKMFAVIYHVATYTAKKKGDALTVDWISFRKYCQRVFMESPVRIEQALYLLVNLKFVQMEMVKDEIDPEAPEVLGYLHFKNLEALGAFAEFFRKNYDPKDPKAFLKSPGAQSLSVKGILKEIDYWNKSGLPKGMPAPPDPKAKFPPKKKAS